MSDAAINSRVELIAEAVEALIAVTVYGHLHGSTMQRAEVLQQADRTALARSDLGDALRAALTPVLRVASETPPPIVIGGPLVSIDGRAQGKGKT